jgi:integrase
MAGTSPKRGATSTDEVDMPPNLRKTPHGYTYLKTVPADLQEVLGKTVVKKALGPKFSVAKLRWAELEAETTELFQKARQQLQGAQTVEDAIKAYLAKPRATRLKALEADSPGLAAQLSALYLAGLSGDSLARSKQERWLNTEEPKALTSDLHRVLENITGAVVSGDVSAFVPVVEQLTEWRGYRLVDTSGDGVQALTYEFLKAAQHGCRVLLARQNGEFAEPIIPDVEPLPAVWELGLQPRVIQSKKPRLSDMTSIYADRLSASLRKTQTTNLSWWKRLVVYCRDKQLDDVTSKEIYEFFENRLNDLIKPWSMKYESKVASGLSEVFALAQAKGMCHRNPVAELGTMPIISAAQEKERMKPRKPFSVEQLNILFSSEWYDPGASNWIGRMKWDLGARYWVPLLCLYHGLRVREPLQLLVSDVVSGAVPLLKIRTDADDLEMQDLPKRSLKNPSTYRTLPVHPVLLELGFMEFVETAKRRGRTSPLFPSALPKLSSKHPMWGRAYEQRFVPFVRDDLEFGSGFGNHSFRHLLEDRIRDAQVDEMWPAGLGQFYSGRKMPRDKDRDFFRQVGSDLVYGKGYDPTRILRYVEKIQYADLKLPKRFVCWLDGRPAVDDKLISFLDGERGNDWRGAE